MNKQQVYEALRAKCNALNYTTLQQIDGDWSIVTYTILHQICFKVYNLSEGEKMPELNMIGGYNVPIVVFNGENACIYALPFANGMWYCNQPIYRQFDNMFLAKIFSLLDNNTPDNKFLHTIEVTKAGLPHIIVAYIRDYELAKAITNGQPDDALDNVIVSALQKQHFQRVQKNIIPLQIPCLKKNYIVNHLFGIYKRGWYNVAVLPQNLMHQQNKDINKINHLLTNISLEIYYIPRYEYGVEILPYPMTWCLEWIDEDIQNLQMLCSSTYKFLSNEI